VSKGSFRVTWVLAGNFRVTFALRNRLFGAEIANKD
jgi:hypothetical protein